MEVVSVNVGIPKEIEFEGKKIITSIYKDPVSTKVKLEKLNLYGDKQADLSVHGGPFKAIYSYPIEHYKYWEKKYPNKIFSIGFFGENLTTKGLLECEVNVGDRFKIGSARIVATQPRLPCYKLGARSGTMNIIKQFLDSEKTGIYFKVLKSGFVEPGNQIELINKDPNNVTVQDIVRLHRNKSNMDMMERAMKLRYLPQKWKFQFAKTLNSLKK